MSNQQFNYYLGRSISIADFICEGSGHSISEAAKEFKCSKNTIRNAIDILGSNAFYGNEPNEKELKIKYLKVKKTLDRLAK